MKIRKLFLLAVCAVVVTGCSNKSNGAELRWDNGAITSNGVSLDIDTYNGYEAAKVGEQFDIKYYSCSGPDDCPHNLIGVDKNLMTKYKDSYYYTAFFDTVMNIYTQRGKVWNEGMMNTDENSGYQAGFMAESMLPVLKALPLDGSVERIVINDSVALKTVGVNYEVRTNCVVVPGFLKVGRDEGTVRMEDTVILDEKTVGHKLTMKYEYYQYKDVVIQAAAGVNILDYLIFL